MNSRLGKKWVAAGVIWGIVLAMTGWNIHLVDQVQSRRRALGTLQMDLGYLEANQAGILEVNQQQSRRVHEVKSFGLGFLVVENNLKRLSRDWGLVQMRVEADENSLDTGSVPISIFSTGPIPGIVEWIAAVEDAYPYLVIERMEISYDHRTRKSLLQATFNYHYTLDEAERTG